MAQESLRSVVYRSFVTCDDPRGVVEGKTIKISKTDSTKMGSQPKHSKEKEKMSSFKRATKVLDFQKTPSSCQLVEVKNGAQKLNRVIDSWSRGVGYGGPSKEIAKDLLKGALDLQESLMMLGRLQESAFSGKRKLPLPPDVASTSSSRSSSMVYSSHECTSSESLSSRATEEKPKGSNLIAKLMGLEEFPLKAPPSCSRKHFFGQKLDREQTTLHEIIETMQSQGFLRSNKHQERRFKDDVPPVVLMKSQRANTIRKLHQEKAKAEEKAVKTRAKLPSNKQKALVPVVTKPQSKQEMEKKIDKIQKMAPTVRRKPVATENVKSTNSVSKNTCAAKQVKPQRNRTTPSNVSSTKLSNQKKNMKIGKLVQDPLTAIIHEASWIDAPNGEEDDDSDVLIKEVDNGGQQSLCVSNGDSSATRNNHEESSVCDVNKRRARILKTVGSFQDSEPDNSDVYLDCVNEFLEHENLRTNPTVHPWLQISMLTSRFGISEDQLVREIMNRVENLRNYSKILKKSYTTDTVYGLLERDLCWSAMGGSWSTGWKDGCTRDEVEEVVLYLEKMILSKSIDDMLMELVTYKGRGWGGGCVGLTVILVDNKGSVDVNEEVKLFISSEGVIFCLLKWLKPAQSCHNIMKSKL